MISSARFIVVITVSTLSLIAIAPGTARSVPPTFDVSAHVVMAQLRTHSTLRGIAWTKGTIQEVRKPCSPGLPAD